ncbi:hypothetical protein [Halobaculum sp. EA56]|uniref:hypothetical protein n=1 Tax=Halobaculum sp. EA56 TaxID=3421648 RepID=UPI003EB6CE58
MSQEVTPGAVLWAAARVLYTELVTVVSTSLAFVVVALPLVTVGAGVLALVETWTTIIGKRDTGAPVTERARLRLFVRSVRRHLWAGLPYSVALLGVTGLTAVYAAVGLSTRSGVFVIAAIVGVYAVIGVTLWCLRAASVAVRTEPTPPARVAIERAGLTLLDRPYFTVLVATLAAVVVVLGALVRVAVPLLVPAVLAVVEVVAFEELAGEGAAAVRATYTRES